VVIELCALARRHTLVIAHHFNRFTALLLARPASATVCGQRRHPAASWRIQRMHSAAASGWSPNYDSA
jgi:hypothetical protein